MTAGKGIVVGLVLLWLALGVDAAVLVWMSQGGISGPDHAHLVWLLLAPILPSLFGLLLVVVLAYVVLGLRR